MTSTSSIVPMGALDPAAPFIHDTVRWLEKAVIGLNLCPFAKGVHVKGQVHYAVALTENPDILATVARLPAGQRPWCVGFAAESHDVVKHAREKLT
eukprot:gene36693-59841_t